MSNTIVPPTPSDWIRHIAAARAAAAEVWSSRPWGGWDPDQPENRALETALAVLCLDFELAPWGQNGNCFVTSAENARWETGAGMFRQLFIQGRRVATWSSKTGKVTLIDLCEAEKDFEHDRAARREREAQYQQERELLIERLVATNHRRLASFGEWIYVEGQKGGYFYRPNRSEEIRVAAEPAIRAAMQESGHHRFETHWDLQIHGARY